MKRIALLLALFVANYLRQVWECRKRGAESMETFWRDAGRDAHHTLFPPKPIDWERLKAREKAMERGGRP